MNTIHPWQLLLITIAGWINRHQQYVIDYLVEENRVLKGQLRGRRVRLTDDERRRLAVKGKILARKVLEEVATIVTPDTIMAWFRRLVARKWDYSLTRNKTGRPRTDVEISDLILRLLNAYAERFVLSIKTECLDRMIFFTEQSLRRATVSFVDHYHRERCHQGLGNRLIEPDESPHNGKIRCRERLGGLLRYYYRDAA